MRHTRIALSGASGSGKGYVGDYLQDQYGFVIVSSGSIFRAISNLLYGDESKGHLNLISQAVRSIDVSLPINATLQHHAAIDRVVFDSVRYLSDVTDLRGRGFAIWRVDSPLDLRLARLEARGQLIDPADMEHASEVELENAQFDAVIYNGADTSALELREQVDRYMT